MRFRAELCHVDTLRCVVRVEAWQSDSHCVGSRLGEAANAEEAEDRARQRLIEALTSTAAETPTEPKPAPSAPVDPPASATPAAAAKPKANAVDPSPPAPVPQQQPVEPPSETPTDPEDWSEELTAIDLELKRIGWGRDQERIFLERAFGHAGRHRLTRYADLVAYLRQLRQFQPGDQPEQAMVPIRRGDLISQGDQMLRDLGWSGEQARQFLDQHLKAKSRQQLSDEQLLQFNMLLEEQTIKAR